MTRAICVVRHGYYPDCPRVFKEVRTLYEAGYHVDVICLRRFGEERREIVDGVHVFRLSHRHHRNSLLRYFYEYTLSVFKMSLMVTALHFRRSYDCIQVNTLPDLLVFVTIIARFFGAKVLLDMHEPTPELFMTKYGRNRHRPILKLIVLMEQLSLKYADSVLTVNHLLRKRFIDRGADGRKIYVIRNVSYETFIEDISNRKANRSFILLTHGTIQKRNGYEVVIRSLPILRKVIEDFQLVIVGDGENLDKVRRLAQDIECSDIVSFIGRVPLSEIGHWISQSDIGLVPLLRSPFGELCQPIKMFEYVAYRKPVVAPRLKAIEEIFDDSCVMFYEPGNHGDLARCILELYHNPEKRYELVENAYRAYDKVRWRETKKIYLEIIRDLTDETKELSSKQIKEPSNT